MIKLALNLLDPMRLVALHRTAQFRAAAVCGRAFKATERANIYSHRAERSAIHFGDDAYVDGTVEVYDRGVLTVGVNFFLGRSRIYCAHNISIGDHVLISDNVSVMDSDLHPIQASRRRAIAAAWALGEFPDVYDGTPGSPVKISDDVWIGYGACVLKGVNIGQGAIIGACSLVTTDVRPWTIVAGSPAREIREIPEYER